MTSAKIGTSLPVEKVTDNRASVTLSCPSLSQPLTLCFVNNDIADLGSTGPAHPLGHGPLLCISYYISSL